MIAERDPEVQAAVRRTGLFLVAVVLTLFTSSTAFILWRWHTR